MAPSLTITFGTKQPPLISAAVSALAGGDIVSFKEQKGAAQKDNAPTLTDPASSAVLRGDAVIARFLVRSDPALSYLYGNGAFEASVVDQWIDQASDEQQHQGLLAALNLHLQMRTTVAGTSQLTLADLAVWAAIQISSDSKKHPVHVKRFLKYLDQCYPQLKKSLSPFQVGQQAVDPHAHIVLKDAVEGKVVTRFPPEPSGYMHIGHVKAALLNKFFRDKYKGTLIIRFDDTNPAKEKEEFVQNIVKDLATLGIVSDVPVTYTSDHFERLMKTCERLIKDGTFYADNTPIEQMRKERMERINSKCRDNSIEENLRAWDEMKKGSEEGQTYAIRVKWDMKDDNGALRDPIMYRVNLTPHHRTGSKFKVYPTYDFACPLIDSWEGVTHALRSNEYNARVPQYFKVLKMTGDRAPIVYEFSRLNLYNTVLSKRKLQWFVDTGRVEGWFDPRFPTVQGIMRRGMTVEGLKEFILQQGQSQNNNFQDWDKIWALNKQVIDPKVPRYQAVSAETGVKLTIVNHPSIENVSRPAHPKNPDCGTKVVSRTPQVWIEGEDAAMMEEGKQVTLMDWGNINPLKITKDGDKVVAVEGEFIPNGDVKKTAKLNWVPADSSVSIEVELYEFDNLVSKKKLEPEDNFEDYLNPNTKFMTKGYADANVRTMKKGDICQFVRRGFFYVDHAPVNDSDRYRMHFIPDGRASNASILNSKVAVRSHEKSRAEQAADAKK
eukprot:TRINITY_DN28913_c0_g1_i1.p1 TRINITY_DN28913_c0_g1~~TRINITY_DN28913_c0_g1_i1.p1  ORF type:complete len:736 (+),score=245.73 TRINITY_DN28913_c0_g1_i1:44-2209(+)